MCLQNFRFVSSAERFAEFVLLGMQHREADAEAIDPASAPTWFSERRMVWRLPPESTVVTRLQTIAFPSGSNSPTA